VLPLPLAAQTEYISKGSYHRLCSCKSTDNYCFHSIAVGSDWRLFSFG